MVYINDDVITGLYETLNITHHNLKTILTVDHPPSNYLAQINKNMDIIKYIIELIRDCENKIILQSLR